jgi:hypothetical protein
VGLLGVAAALASCAETSDLVTREEYIARVEAPGRAGFHDPALDRTRARTAEERQAIDEQLDKQRRGAAAA